MLLINHRALSSLKNSKVAILRNEERGRPPKKFEDSELQALLDEDDVQTQQPLADQLNVTREAVSIRLKAMEKIQKMENHHTQQNRSRTRLRRLKWLGNELNPEDWGWITINEILEPIQTLLPSAPDILLNIIFCNYSKDCGFNCSCRKVGLRCSAVCGNCHDQSCTNHAEDITEDIYPINLAMAAVEEMEEMKEMEEMEETDTEIIEFEEISEIDKTEK
ncbi:uncharacterized protein LOC118645201 [Monomorium pharaonis]|uniref:uncharacterized protein LOC118645201 n=1 Tax=Monomorium pharaonis TaxID=307658 RepID=UPI001747AA82|nr:uncharacterized protein LOC118645201 [Monomorium pharaonis]